MASLSPSARAIAAREDTFYVGTLKGVGRIYQQTFVDTYAKVGFANLGDCPWAKAKPRPEGPQDPARRRGPPQRPGDPALRAAWRSAAARAHRPRDRILRDA